MISSVRPVLVLVLALSLSLPLAAGAQPSANKVAAVASVEKHRADLIDLIGRYKVHRPSRHFGFALGEGRQWMRGVGARSVSAGTSTATSYCRPARRATRLRRRT